MSSVIICNIYFFEIQLIQSIHSKQCKGQRVYQMIILENMSDLFITCIDLVQAYM